MMAKARQGRRRVDEETKNKAIQEVKDGALRREVAEKYGVSLGAVNVWMSGGSARLSRKADDNIEKKLQALQLENSFLRSIANESNEMKRLQLEITYLKERLKVYEGA